MSSRSKWILDEKKYNDMYETESSWNKKSILNKERCIDKSVNEYIAKKKYEEQVICTFKPEISENSKIITQKFNTNNSQKTVSSIQILPFVKIYNFLT